MLAGCQCTADRDSRRMSSPSPLLPQPARSRAENTCSQSDLALQDAFEARMLAQQEAVDARMLSMQRTQESILRCLEEIQQAQRDTEKSQPEAKASPRREAPSEDVIRRTFERIDVNSDGVLDAGELQMALIELGVEDIDADEVGRMMQRYDTDRNNVLDPDEFTEMVKGLVSSGQLAEATLRTSDKSSKEDEEWEHRLRRGVLDGDPDLKKEVEELRSELRKRPSSLVRRGTSRLSSPRTKRQQKAADVTRDPNLDPDSATASAATSPPYSHGGSPPYSRGGSGTTTPSFTSSRAVSTSGEKGGAQHKGSAACGGLNAVCAPVVCRACGNQHLMLHPYGRLRSVWNVIIAVLIAYCGVVVPLEIAFEATMRKQTTAEGWVAWEMFNLVIDMLFILDIVLNCVPRPQPQASLLRPCLTRACGTRQSAQASSSRGTLSPTRGSSHNGTSALASSSTWSAHFRSI